MRPKFVLAGLLLLSFGGSGKEPTQRGTDQAAMTSQHATPARQHTNRLSAASSPYLLQHADNPVHWYEWGEEAFEAARSEDKPIFLSIGYATCHWCHVMEHESFEDEEVARLMNDTFISIKVDREERPDIDNIYMAVCQMMTGHGGWPLTIVMTPDKQPFFAGTYFPKNSRSGRIGMLELVPRIKELWQNDRDKLDDSAERVVQALLDSQQPAGGEDLDAASLSAAREQLGARFDAVHGGFGSKPKFPTPHQLLFLLRHWHRTGDAESLSMVEKTLEAMRLGGIYDQVGFGFHRYSTDERWHVPHFEKMLYDQAMLTLAYTEAYQATGNELLRRTVEETFTYVLRDMTAPEGGFYSAEDADSEGEEGKFYLWTEAELRQVLTPREAEFAIATMNAAPDGNFQDEATGSQTGDNILHLSRPLPGEEQATWDRLRPKLFAHREKRIRPLRDDKILTDWNGLMISALARAGQALDRDDYIAAADKAAGFLLANLQDKQGRLLHRYRNGQAGIRAHVDDYAFLVGALLDLYEATFSVRYLKKALALNGEMLERFWDEKHGGLFFTADDGESLLVRSKESYDGAVPAGNSVAALNLLRLGRITSDPALEERAAAIGRTFAHRVAQAPTAFTQLLNAVAFAVGPAYEVVIAGQPGSADADAMLAALRRSYHPNKVVIFHPQGDGQAEIVRLAPFIKSQTSLNGKATAYVCRNYTCQAPTTDVEVMLAALDGK